jgi:hypothetical protein
MSDVKSLIENAIRYVERGQRSGNDGQQRLADTHLQVALNNLYLAVQYAAASADEQGQIPHPDAARNAGKQLSGQAAKGDGA